MIKRPNKNRRPRRRPRPPVVSTVFCGVSQEEAAASAATVFQGETMACALCNTIEQSSPDRNSDWRAVEINGRRFYVCPLHFPDDTQPSHEFCCAYLRVLEALQRLS